MKIAVVTACYGNYDYVWAPVHQTVDCDFHCFGKLVDGWECHDYAFCRSMPDVYVAKVPKMIPEYALANWDRYDGFVWMDASIHIKSDRFVEWLLDYRMDSGKDWVLFQHSKRKNVEEEIKHSLSWVRYSNEPLWTQYGHYMRCGFQDNRLWECTVFLRMSTETSRQIVTSWMLHNHLWSYADQISLPFVMWKHQYDPVTVNASVWKSDYHEYHGHSTQHYGRPISYMLHPNVQAS